MATLTSARSSSAAYAAPAAATRALPSATAASAVNTSTSARLHAAPATGAQASCAARGALGGRPAQAVTAPDQHERGGHARASASSRSVHCTSLARTPPMYASIGAANTDAPAPSTNSPCSPARRRAVH